MKVESLFQNVKKLKPNLTYKQADFRKIEQETAAPVTASYKASKMIVMFGESYSESVFIKKCLVKTT